MTLGELQDFLENVCESSDLFDPEIFIRVGNFQAPLAHIRVVQEDDNFHESIILEDNEYKDLLI